MPAPQNVQDRIVQRAATQRKREGRRFVIEVKKVFCDASRDFIDEEDFVHTSWVGQAQRGVLLDVVAVPATLIGRSNPDAGHAISDNHTFTPNIPHTVEQVRWYILNYHKVL